VTINDNIIYCNKKEEGKKKTKEKKNVKLSGSTEKLFGSLDFIQQIQDCFKEYVAIMQQKLNPYQKVSMMLNLLFVVKNLLLNKIFYLKTSQLKVYHTKPRFKRHMLFWISNIKDDKVEVNTKYMVPVKTNVGIIKALLDTGSTINLIRKDVVEEYKMDIIKTLRTDVYSLQNQS